MSSQERKKSDSNKCPECGVGDLNRIATSPGRPSEEKSCSNCGAEFYQGGHGGFISFP